MKRIILVREYILLLIIGILGLLVFYGMGNFGWVKTIERISDLSIYFFSLFMYMLIAVEALIRIKRLKGNEMKAIKADLDLLKTIEIVSIIFIHLLFWDLYFRSPHTSIVAFLGVSPFWFRDVVTNTAYISNEKFVVGNKIYFIDLIENTENVDESLNPSFKIVFCGDQKTVRCGSKIVKEKLMKEIELFKEQVRGK